MKTLSNVTHAIFALFVILSLTTPSWRYGVFSWFPFWRYDLLAGAPMQVGIFNLLPILLVGLWAWLQKRAGSWRWGPRIITVPLLLFSLWAGLRVLDATPRHIFIYLGDLILVWLVYLYVVNWSPRLRPILAAVIVVQGLVACLQFVLQRDLGLALLGELPLNPAFSGVTVLQARGEPWLRAYGLTAHPNLLGALLALSVLLVLARSREGWPGRPVLWLPVLALGFGGLFFSFSRTAWLGVATGLVGWAFLRRRAGAQAARVSYMWLLVPALLLVLAGILYGDLVVSRFARLQEPIEAQSISQRLNDARLALQLAAEHPWLGVGLGRNVHAAMRLSLEADRVHNVFLLAAAELGIPGLIFVSWLLLGPLWAHFGLYRRGEYARCAAGLAPWLLLVVVNQFDVTLWLTGNWQTAILFALAAANSAQHLCAATEPSQSMAPMAEAHSA